MNEEFDMITWAKLLIEQLPEGHEGKESWLLNYQESTDSE